MRMLKSLLVLPLILVMAGPAMVQAAQDRDKLEAFLKITGFDVALESIRLSASSAPAMIGMDTDDFGIRWTQLTRDVFDPKRMQTIAIDILDKTLDDAALEHATSFYASDLGQRLVAAENASHIKEDREGKTEAGAAIVSGLSQLQSSRIDQLKRMTAASDGAGSAIQAIQEVQVRFLMAAAGAGVIELALEEPDLRSLFEAQEPELREAIQASSLNGAAYTYQAFSDEEVAQYADALEHPKMQEVYELMNIIQYEIMANRFEALAQAMSGLTPSTDL